MNELQLQRELVKATMDEGGFGFKANNRFLIGVADLHLALPPMPPCWAEIKYRSGMPRNSTVDMELTSHQRRFLRNVNRCGGFATCVIVVAIEHGAYQIGVVPREDLPTCDTLASFDIIRERGHPWPIRRIIGRVVC